MNDACLVTGCEEPIVSVCHLCNRPICREHRVESGRVYVDGLWFSRDRCVECEQVVMEARHEGRPSRADD